MKKKEENIKTKMFNDGSKKISDSSKIEKISKKKKIIKNQKTNGYKI